MFVVRNLIKNPNLVPVIGVTKLIVHATSKQKGSIVEGTGKWWSYEVVVIILAQNCGVNVIRTLTVLQGKHTNGKNAWLGKKGN